MKSVVFDLSDGVYEDWMRYKKKHGYEADSGALFHLLEELRYSQDDILNFIQSAAICIIDASGVLTEEEFGKLPSLTHYLCGCDRCEESECLAHTDLKGSIAVSRKNFANMLSGEFFVAVGLLTVLHSYIHEMVHNLYPDAPQDDQYHGGVCSKVVQEKTKEIWLKGMTKTYDSLVPQE